MRKILPTILDTKHENILSQERSLAKAVASAVIESRPPTVWEITIPILFILNLFKFKRSREIFALNFLFTKKLALEAAFYIIKDGQSKEEAMVRIKEKTKEILAFDNKEIWKKYDYKKLGIIGEPYFDVDFNEVFYATDTGRRWDGFKVSVRDKVQSDFNHFYHETDEIIKAAENVELPDKIMFTFHPQRWHQNKYLWTKEFIMQNVKNSVKKWFYVK